MQERDSRKDDDKFLGDACGNSGNNAKTAKSRWEAIGKPLDILVSCMMSRILNVAMFVHYCSLTYEFHGTSKCRGISLSL